MRQLAARLQEVADKEVLTTAVRLQEAVTTLRAVRVPVAVRLQEAAVTVADPLQEEATLQVAAMAAAEAAVPLQVAATAAEVAVRHRAVAADAADNIISIMNVNFKKIL